MQCNTQPPLRSSLSRLVVMYAAVFFEVLDALCNGIEPLLPVLARHDHITLRERVIIPHPGFFLSTVSVP